MATVYLAHDLKHDREVAIKGLRDALNRTEQEAAQSMPQALAARLTELRAARLVLSASVEAEIAVGQDEVRAWPIRCSAAARQAAGRIHSDLERGFIRAEVIPYNVFTQFRSGQAVKDAGRLQIEGKDYVVADGEILHIRFNV